MKVYKVKVNGKVYEVELEAVSEKAEAIKTEAPVAAASAPVASGNGEVVVAPMQGAITKIEVEVGTTVKKGDKLFILEAMKMENEILAPVDGKVIAIKVSKGQTVNSKQELLIIG